MPPSSRIGKQRVTDDSLADWEIAMQHSHIDKLLDIYLDSLISISNDAGWGGESMMAKIIEFGADIPRGTGNDQSNMTMIIALENFRKEHHDTRKIRAVVGELLNGPSHKAKTKALLSRRYYHSINADTGRLFTDLDRMRLVGGYEIEMANDESKAIKRFGGRVRAAYEVLELELDKYERYQEATLVMAG